MAIDPVCGMTVDEEKAAAWFIHEGTTYYFCSTQCLGKFEANASDFTLSAAHSAKAREGMHTMPATEAKSSKGMAKDPIFCPCPVELPLEPAPETRGMSLNWMAPFYDWLCLRFGLGVPFRKETLRYAALQPGEKVLDVGCGTGVLTRMAAEAVGPTGKAIGIDPAPKMIGLARKNATFFSNSAEFRLAAIEHLPFDDETFDAVLSSAMIHHLPPDLKHAGLLEVKRVLKPGGRLVVVDLDRPANLLWWFLVWPLLIMPSTRDHLAGRLAPYFTQAGFDPVTRVGRWRGLLSFWLAYKINRGTRETINNRRVK